MAFSPWQMLSPVQWAKWTWSAVRGSGGEGEEEDGGSQDSGSDSEGNFDTPEADTPIPSPIKEPVRDLRNDIAQLVSELSLKDNNNIGGEGPSLSDQETKTILDESNGSYIKRNTDGPDANANDSANVTSTNDISVSSTIINTDQQTEESSVDHPSSRKNTDARSLELEDVENGNCETDDGSNEPQKSQDNVLDAVPGTEERQDNKAISQERTEPDGGDASKNDIQLNAQSKNRKMGSRLPSKKQKEGANKTASLENLENNNEIQSSATDPLNVPLAKSSYNFDLSHLDDPNFNPFGGKSALSSSPTLRKGSFNNDREIPDEPNPCKTLSTPDTDSGRAKSSPKMGRSRLITNSCKVQNYEGSSLVLDVCAQGEDSTPNIEKRQGHATDEEKLAFVPAPKPSVSKCQPEEEQEFFECTNDGTSGKVPLVEQPLPATPIIMKEIEVEDWKAKHEESHREVLEMRKIVAEYEKTIAQMIEDEQRSKMSSQKSLQQLTLEKDQAIADLNSVERSLSDLFRRYENLKGVLEGFKKNQEIEELTKICDELIAKMGRND
ncbi:hypothetical protein GDO86_006806 [Hymenochirus boettgeri]|uniref:Transforming acidic coiled-coil-containing protein C-terminal domain-containing protein n=1 Tax=Hymenochirus boettgeri TaxID=247094 RepID=A0A8T2JFF8_9PIPI|nr:hypothetical protein GDO86_006806 [Hymenochirus boettgeri]